MEMDVELIQMLELAYEDIKTVCSITYVQKVKWKHKAIK